MDKQRTTKHYRKMIVHGDHLESCSPPWTVLWQIKEPPDDSWSSAVAASEQGAIDRATHFLRLGFVVHAIKNPSGAVVMDQAWIATRCGTLPGERPKRYPQPIRPPAEGGDVQDDANDFRPPAKGLTSP